MDLLVSTEWLAGNLHAPGLKIVDATNFLPDTPRDPRAEYAAAHIPGAVFLDLATFADPDDPSPGMLPPDALATERLRALGLSDGDRVVVYDNTPIHTSARAWWMFRVFGVSDVAILDGGMPKWLAEGRATDAGWLAVAPGNVTVRSDRTTLRTKADMLANVGSGAEQVVDARGAGRFTGEEKEPRAGMASGHIPGSLNLPYATLFNADNGMKQGGDLRAAFDAAGVDLTRPMITTCGSGVTAAIVMAGAHLLGSGDVSLYDGSWSEWGIDPDTPKATGPA
jgi:thiosulfate/3-mercaptopyruvate sulfurtransferase